MAKAAFNRNNTLFRNKSDLNLSKKQVKGYIWVTVLYGAETWTFRNVYQKHLESFKMRCQRRMEKNIWADRVRSE